MAKEAATSRSIGRPREQRADRAILAAALELMAEHGVRDLRMDDVAERAGVGKATIYRRHRSKDELVTAAVAALVTEITVPDTGSTRDDLLGLMRAAVRAVLERGVERGDLRADLDLELALDVLAGPLFYRLLVTGGPIDERLAQGVVDLVQRGFAPNNSNPSKSPNRTRKRPR